MMMTISEKAKAVLSLLGILAVGLIAYSNTYQVPFQGDEEFYLSNNPFVRDWRYPIDSLRPREGQTDTLRRIVFDPELYKTLKMRYVGYLTFALNYRMHGMQVEGYHAANVIIHILNAVLVYVLVVTLFQTPLLRESILKERSPILALVSGLLFVAHPVQTEAVTNIMQRLASLVTTFYLVSVVTYLRSRIAPSPLRRYALSLASLASAVIAMKTKENAFTLPVMIAAFELILFQGGLKERVIRLAPVLSTLLIIPLTLVLTLGADMGTIIRAGRVPEPLYYFLSQFRSVASYLGLLVLPVRQSVFHGHTVATSPFHAGVLLPLALLLLIAGYGLYLFRRSRISDGALRIMVIGMLWFFLALSVESSIIPLPILMCEYRAYLPSIGFFLFLVTGIFYLAAGSGSRKAERTVIVAILVAVIALSAATYRRNALWGDVVGLWEEALSRYPSFPTIHWTLGQLYIKQGRYDEALAKFRAAERLGMNHPRLRAEMGAAYSHLGRYDEAIGEYHEALRLFPNFSDAHYNLGAIYTRQERPDDALREYQAAVRLDPGHLEARNNLAGTLMQLGRYAEARKELEELLTRNPDLPDIQYNLDYLSELEKQRQVRK